MTSEEFIARQTVLGLNSSELADALQSNSGAVSRWTKGKAAIPGYIAVALDALVAQSLPQMELPLSLSDLAALDREARARGVTIPRLISDILHAALNPAAPTNITPISYAPLAEDSTLSGRVAEDTTDTEAPDSKAKH